MTENGLTSIGRSGKSEAMTDRKRILQVTAGNLRQSHLYINGHLDFFSKTVVGGSKRAGNEHGTIEIFLDGLNETVTTDIGSDAKSGKPRGFLRGRSWVRRFFQFHEVKPGALLSLEKTLENTYRLSVSDKSPESHRKLRAAEFFAGIGLVRLALERKGWEVVFANDIDADKAEIYLHNWPKDEQLRVEDIHLLKADEIPSCDLFTASFPCNDLSIAGRWEGLDGKESSAFWGLMDILRDLGERRPPFVMLENVVGFLMSKKGRDFEKALLALNELGYVVDAFILNAVHWIPQSRSRLFVIAKQDDSNEERRTAAFVSDSRPTALLNFIHSHDNIRWDLRDLPPLPPTQFGVKNQLRPCHRRKPHDRKAAPTRTTWRQWPTKPNRDRGANRRICDESPRRRILGSLRLRLLARRVPGDWASSRRPPQQHEESARRV